MCCRLSGTMGASLHHSVHLIFTIGCASNMLEAVRAKPIASQTLLSIYLPLESPTESLCKKPCKNLCENLRDNLVKDCENLVKNVMKTL